MVRREGEAREEESTQNSIFFLKTDLSKRVVVIGRRPFAEGGEARKAERIRGSFDLEGRRDF
jgi:hypothetical protein